MPILSPFVSREKGFEVYRFHTKLAEGTVIDRPNRFIVNVKADGERIQCHIHDPGRLEELIYPGNRVLIRETPGNKTHFSVTAAFNDGKWIITDTRIHSDIASKFILTDAKREVQVGRKRLDFKIGDHYVEVKGCTLMVNGKAMFPDSPTLRGKEHMDLLAELVKSGAGASVLILVMRDDVKCFSTNSATDPEFSRSFARALREGVRARILRFGMEGNAVIFRGEIGLC